MDASIADSVPIVSLDRSKIDGVIRVKAGWLLLESASFEFSGAELKAGDSISAVASVGVELSTDNEVTKELLVEMVEQAVILRVLYKTDHFGKLFFEDANVVCRQTLRPETWCKVKVTVDDISENSLSASGRILLPSTDDGVKEQLVGIVSICGTYTTKH
ncbi:MAG: hypothetical protein CMI53_04360 [Parcubacteria group bacterium]|nr:hypothetical protein [Parcubacteria group bacterium]|tara:strand:- start:574 stop:1053 length:480 start_codon:yes stop_codon:yes gene_type:complete